MTTTFADVGQDGREGVVRRASHDSCKVGRTLVERVFDSRVEYLVSVLSDEVLSQNEIVDLSG
jgi:hypothetical protein